MAWTTPKTWAFQEGVESAELNTYLRDNQLAMGPHLIARKTSDESVVSSTVLQDDDVLLMNVAANEVWQVQFFLRHDGNGGDLKVSFGLPSGGRVDAHSVAEGASGTIQHNTWAITATDGATQHFNDGTGTIRSCVIHGWFINGGTAGNYTLRWAQQNSSANATVIKAQSTLWAVKLA